MCDKMAISSYILKIVERDPLRAKEMLNEIFISSGTIVNHL